MHTKTLIVGILLAISSLVQPAAAIPTTNLALWLKASVGVEEASADPAENNDFISAWRDQSGNGFDAFPRAISGNSDTLYKPTFVTNGVNNKPALLFTLGPGNLEYARLALTTPLLTGAGDFHIFAVVKYSTVNPNGEKIIGANYGITNSGGLEFYSFQQTQRLFKAGSVVGTSNVQDNTWHLFEARRVGGTVSLWIDNHMEASGSLPTAIAGNIPWTIGNGGDYPSGPLGYMAEQIVYNGNLSSNNIHLVVRQLADDYNLAIIPEPASTTLAFIGLGASMLLCRRRRMS